MAQKPIPLPEGSDAAERLEPSRRRAAAALNRAGATLESHGMGEHIEIGRKLSVYMSVLKVGEGKAFVSRQPAYDLIINSVPFSKLWGGHQIGAMLHEIHHFSRENVALYNRQVKSRSPMGTGTPYENNAYDFQDNHGFPSSGYYDY